MMNKVILIGRTTDKPQVKQTSNGTAVSTFTIAVTRPRNRELTDFVTIVTWRGLAENCGKYLDKGQQVAVDGELQSRTYEDKNGNKRTVWEVVANDVTFLAKANREKDTIVEAVKDIELIPTDEELPF